MAAPEHVPSDLSAKPRTGLAMPPARPWDTDRPGALGSHQPSGPGFGNPGPDQGYALLLARRFEGRLVLTLGEHLEDVVAGCVGIAMARSALFGRAPVVHDLTVCFSVWGFLTEAPADLVAYRKPLFQSAAHHYAERRSVVDLVPDATLRLPHAEVVRRSPAEWRTLLTTDT